MRLGTGVIGGLNTRLVFTDANHSLPINLATQTVNGLSFGDPHPRRRVFVGIAVTTATGVEPNVMTIGGIAATKHVGLAPGGSPSATSQIWSALVPTGATGTVQFSVPSSDIDGGSVYVWAGYDLGSSAPTATTTVSNVGAASSDMSLDVTPGGFVIAVAVVSNTFVQSFSFSSLSRDSFDNVPNLQSAAGHVSKSVGGSPFSIIATRTQTAGTFGVNGVAASFR